MTMQEQIRALVVRHHANLLEQIDVIRQLFDAPDADGNITNASIVEAESIMHQLKGTAGSMGFPTVSAAATTLDDTLKALKRLNVSVPPADLKDARELLDALQRIAETTPPEMSTLYNADLSRLAQ